ncbi:MAG: DUF4115 domain-containing protein [Gammaproteobacteria bacterium]|nr:DUF4115 domain-containing protein [Gammaproteobacteria bacterium]
MSVTGDAQDAQRPTVEKVADDLAADDGGRSAHTRHFGPALREAREIAGLSVVEIANALKVTERTVDALEAERYEDLPPRPYVRGYVRRYARLVGLDPGSVTVGSDIVEAEPVPPAVVPRSPRTLFSDLARESWGLMYGSIVLVFVILIGAALWWAWLGGDIERPVWEAAPNTVGADPAPTAVASPPAPEVATEVVSTVQGEPDPEPESTAVPEPSEPVAIDPALHEVATVEPGVVDADTDEAAREGGGLAEPDLITFVFEGDCWVEVRDPGGDLLHGDLGRDGETATVRGDAPFSVLLGNPAVVDVTFNGERVSVDPVRPGQVARFEVGA